MLVAIALRSEPIYDRLTQRAANNSNEQLSEF
jgi:hypothetical protein